MLLFGLIAASTTFAAPTARDLERILQAKEFCFVTIDACAGESGEPIVHMTYIVKAVSCRNTTRPSGFPTGLIERSMRCSYQVRETLQEGYQVAKRGKFERRSGTFDLVGQGIGEIGQEGDLISYFWRERQSEQK